jgi:hypothetical protein
VELRAQCGARDSQGPGGLRKVAASVLKNKRQEMSIRERLEFGIERRGTGE